MSVIKVDIVTSGLSLAGGGPTRTVVQLSQALASCADTKVRVISQSCCNADILLPDGQLVDCYIGCTGSALSLKLGLKGRLILRRVLACNPPQILHSNGIWNPLNHWSTCAARRQAIPLIIQPHGMLEPWALNWHAAKKRLALALYQRRDLESAALLVATAEQEAENLRRFGLRQPIAVIPNGVDLVDKKLLSDTEEGKPVDARYALFMGRVHPVKGLESLLSSWAKVQPKDWILQLAGPDEVGHLSDVLALAQQLGISDQVQYLGELDDQAKWNVYCGADLFVLPSFTENFGVVVAESLASGVPVITTKGAPWQGLETHRCGWWVDQGVDPLAAALGEATSLPREALQAMGERGRIYAKETFGWPGIAEQMLATYRWVLGQRDKPDCVHPD